MTLDRIDVETIERLSDAAMRRGEAALAVEGYALALKLRRELTGDRAGIDFARDGWLSDAIERGLA